MMGRRSLKSLAGHAAPARAALSSFVGGFFKSRAGFFAIAASGIAVFVAGTVLWLSFLSAFCFENDGYHFVSIGFLSGEGDEAALALGAFLVPLVFFGFTLWWMFSIYACLGPGRAAIGFRDAPFSFVDEKREAALRAKEASMTLSNARWVLTCADKVFDGVSGDASEVAELLSSELGMGIVSFKMSEIRVSEKDVDDAELMEKWHAEAERTKEAAIAIADIWASALQGNKLSYNTQQSYRELGRALGVDIMLETYASGVPAEHIVGK